MTARWIWPAFGAVWLVGLALALAYAPTWDVVWRMHIATGMLDGGRLYQDLIEPNPPLWFWAALPGALLAEVLGVSAHAAMVVLGHVAIVPAAVVFARLLSPLLAPWPLLVALVAFAAAAGLIPIDESGQREQAAVVASLLWAALAVRRAEAQPPPPLLAAAAALLAAYGFALKPFFLGVPLVLEMWLLWRLRASWRPVRTETLVLAMCALIYACAVLTLAPLYLREIAPLAGLSWSGIRARQDLPPVTHALGVAATGMIVIVAPALALRAGRPSALLQAVMLSAGALALGAVAQMKGFGYHFIAAKGLTLVALALLAAQGRFGSGVGKVSFAPLVLTVLVAAQIAFPAASALTLGRTPPAEASVAGHIARLARALPEGGGMMVLSANPGHAFFEPTRAGLPHLSRHFSMWMLPGLDSASLDSETQPAALRQAERVREDFVSDITCARPDLIVSETTTHHRPQWLKPEAFRFDPLAFMRDDPAFAGWLDVGYAPVAVTQPDLAVWRRLRPLARPAACPPP